MVAIRVEGGMTTWAWEVGELGREAGKTEFALESKAKCGWGEDVVVLLATGVAAEGDAGGNVEKGLEVCGDMGRGVLGESGGELAEVFAAEVASEVVEL